MYNKSLVSIYFLENLLLISELDSKKKNVKNFSRVELPPGLIEDFKVKDPSVLSVVLKKAFLGARITEKSVGIIVPEFSTFSKLVSLPKLAIGELNEAVMWQAGEYLPEGSENMIIDWKIVERNDSKTDVLIVAIQKDVLAGYVDACEKAGLFPKGVQTPSVCLTNLTSNDTSTSLVYYSGFGETLLIVNQKDRIFGTSVNKGGDIKENAEIASKMLNHYKQLGIQKVLVCGKDIGEELLMSLKEILKIEVTSIDARLGGFEMSRQQELIVPISMLLRELEEPSSSRTINLLPGNLVDKYRSKKSRNEVWTLTLTVTVFVWFCFLIVVGSYLVVMQQIAGLKVKNMGNSDLVANIEKYEAGAKNTNTVAEKVLKIESNYVVPQEVLNIITDSRTSGVSIEKYKMDFDRGLIELSGVSPDRESLLLFKDNLEKTPKVTSVSIPISNFEKINNLEYTISFSYGAKENLNTNIKVNTNGGNGLN